VRCSAFGQTDDEHEHQRQGLRAQHIDTLLHPRVTNLRELLAELRLEKNRCEHVDRVLPPHRKPVAASSGVESFFVQLPRGFYVALSEHFSNELADDKHGRAKLLQCMRRVARNLNDVGGSTNET
jgi:hypothetical protein